MASRRSDVVLSMTLAETFLLLLFLVWLGDVARNPGSEPPTDPTILKSEVERLRSANEQLALEAQRMAAENRELSLTVEAFRKSLGIKTPINGPDDVPDAVARAREAARRGAPKCQSENLFARVSVVDGSTTLIVSAPAAVAATVGEGAGVQIPVDIALTEESAVQAVLNAVSEYSRKNECRFDYTLTYRTKADYYDGREQFEKGRLFYAAGVFRR
jgi:hypothetical protein